MKKIAYITAIALAVFSGGVSTYGLTKFAPGAELVIAAMGLLFEAGKLTAFAMLHHQMPRALKSALLVVGLVLMSLNVMGVSGFLSNAYEHEQTATRASTHTAEAEANADVALIERQLAAAEKALAEANDQLIKAKGNKGKIEAANNNIAAKKKERDALVEKMGAAMRSKAKTEGQTIAASGEFAAIAFVAGLGIDQDKVAHIFILMIASLPDILAVLLLVAAGYTGHKQEVRAAPEPVRVEEIKTQADPKLAKKVKLTPHEIALKGWETRRRNEEARKNGPQLVKNHA